MYEISGYMFDWFGTVVVVEICSTLQTIFPIVVQIVISLLSNRGKQVFLKIANSIAWERQDVAWRQEAQSTNRC